MSFITVVEFDVTKFETMDVSYDSVMMPFRKNLEAVLANREAYDTFLDVSADHELVRLVGLILRDMLDHQAVFENKDDRMFLQHILWFCRGLLFTYKDSSRGTIMFNVIEAFVNDDRSMSVDNKYFKLGQDEEFAQSMIENGEVKVEGYRGF